nr:MAG TPA: Protein of unknown function (DUF2968) [Caudoviricetes sp.]
MRTLTDVPIGVNGKIHYADVIWYVELFQKSQNGFWKSLRSSRFIFRKKC